jgi:hypothetical protein
MMHGPQALADVLSQATCIRLHCREGFVLHVGPGVARPSWFIRSFARVWEQLPSGVRHTLIADWQPRSAERVCPYFYVLDGLRSVKDGRPILGHFLDNPPHLYGWCASLEQVSDSFIDMAVAHEIGHGALFAHQGNPGTEDEVQQMVSDWGFAAR